MLKEQTFKKNMVALLLIFVLFQCSAPKTEDLYSYNLRDITKFLKLINLEDQWERPYDALFRNLDGTKLRILLNDTTVIIIKDTGQWEKRTIPNCDYAWFNNNDQVVIWRKYNPEKQCVELFYINGYSEQAFIPDYGGPGPSGLYFTKEDDDKFIFSIKNPGERYIELPFHADFHVPVFYNNGKIYCFATDPKRDDTQVRTLHVYKIQGNTAKLTNSIDIKYPGKNRFQWFPLDYCPWKEEILISEAHMPEELLFDVYYTFNLKNRELIKIGRDNPFSAGKYIYLKSDILQTAIDLEKSKKR